MMENGVFVIGKRNQGSNTMITNKVMSPEMLNGMSRRGWILSKVERQEAHFHYNFIRECRRDLVRVM